MRKAILAATGALVLSLLLPSALARAAEPAAAADSAAGSAAGFVNESANDSAAGFVNGSVNSSAAGSGNDAANGSAKRQGTVVHLITGDSVRLRTVGGRQEVTALPVSHHGIAGQLQVIRIGGQVYAIPGAARRYLGTSIDPSVFDITALAQAQQAGRTPVRLSFSGAGTHSVPGVRQTGGDAGYLTDSSARSFGRALVAQWKTDTRAGRNRPLFGGLTRIALDTPAAATGPVVHPAYMQVTLVIKVNDQNGKPVSDGSIYLLNTDDSERFANILPVVNGEARASVPLGDYSALSTVDGYDAGSDTASAYQLSVGDYQVSGNLQTMTMSAAHAVPLSISTPRPASTVSQSTEWFRADAGQGGVDSSMSYGPGNHVYVTPTPTVHVGALHWITGWTMGGKPADGIPYSYDASFAETGKISANQRHKVVRGQAAVVDSRYYSDGPNRNSQFVRSPVYPFQFLVIASYNPLRTPVHRTEYLVGGKGVSWEASMLADPTADNPFAGEIDDGQRSYAPGSIQRADWLRGPLAPGVAADTAANPLWTCFSCRTADQMTVDFSPVVDSVSGHSGSVSIPASGHATHFQLYENGRIIDDENGSTGGTFKVPAGAATYRVLDRVNRSQDGFVGSTGSTVDITFRSASPARAGKLPSSWDCDATGSGACAALPILQARIPLPTDLTGHMPTGLSVATFHVDHVQGAPRTPIRSAELQLSFDGGKTWNSQPAVSAGGGDYRTILTNPASAAGDPVSVRLRATDTAGGTLTETVEKAYTVR